MDKREKADELLKVVLANNLSNREKKRALGVFLVQEGIVEKKAAQIIRASDKTVKKHCKKYETSGIEAIKDNPYRPTSELNNYAELIKEELDKEPCQTINQVKAKIENLTGIKRSPTQVRYFLKKQGFRRLMTGQIPAKANTNIQQQFLEKEIEPRLEEEKAGERKVFFVDAAHFVLGAFIGYLWVLTRIFVRTAAGRQRFNVLGAFSVENCDLVTYFNESYINAVSICELMKKIRIQFPDIAITLILDNAKYQKCQLVFDTAKILKIELLYLPPYSPNLNLIERMWRYVRKECLYAKYYETFSDFKQSIINCLSDVGTVRKKDIQKLITTNFQIFNKVKKIDQIAA